jgi:hypothetical protein
MDLPPVRRVRADEASETLRVLSPSSSPLWKAAWMSEMEA